MIEIKFDVVVEETVPKGIYMTVQEYAQAYNLNESTIRSNLSRGTIPSYLFYGKRLIPADFVPESCATFENKTDTKLAQNEK